MVDQETLISQKPIFNIFNKCLEEYLPNVSKNELNNMWLNMKNNHSRDDVQKILKVFYSNNKKTNKKCNTDKQCSALVHEHVKKEDIADQEYVKKMEELYPEFKDSESIPKQCSKNWIKDKNDNDILDENGEIIKLCLFHSKLFKDLKSQNDKDLCMECSINLSTKHNKEIFIRHKYLAEHIGTIDKNYKNISPTNNIGEKTKKRKFDNDYEYLEEEDVFVSKNNLVVKNRGTKENPIVDLRPISQIGMRTDDGEINYFKKIKK